MSLLNVIEWLAIPYTVITNGPVGSWDLASQRICRDFDIWVSGLQRTKWRKKRKWKGFNFSWDVKWVDHSFDFLNPISTVRNWPAFLYKLVSRVWLCSELDSAKVLMMGWLGYASAANPSKAIAQYNHFNFINSYYIWLSGGFSILFLRGVGEDI